MMQERFVRRLAWTTTHEFEEIYTLCKLLPGPIAPQAAIAVGRKARGTAGGIAAGLGFIHPAVVIVIAIAAFYVQKSTGGSQALFFRGMQIGAIALILKSIIQLFKDYRKQTRSWIIALVNFALTKAHPAFEPVYILGSGAIGVIRAKRAKGTATLASLAAPLAASFWVGGGAPLPMMGGLFWSCFKAAAFVFGTGIAVVPVLEYDFVTKFHWVTHGEFMDAVAIGQVTPGPFVVTATFVGYKVSGLVGAFVASAGVFLPSFLNVLLFVPMFLGRLTSSPYVPNFVSFALPAVVGCIGAATWKMIILTCGSTPDLIVLVGVTALQAVRWFPAWGTLLLAALLRAVLASS